MGGTRFGLDLNLQNLSMISVAEMLWDSQDIKNQIRNNFSGRDRKYRDESWSKISKLVVQYGNSINLPPSLSELLKKTILRIGQKIYDWILYVTKFLDLDIVFTQKIYFSLGVVDEVKIFDLYWRDLMARDNFVYKSRYFSHSSLFSLACIFGCEKFVKERKNEMLDELHEFCPYIKAGDEIYNIMSVSICMTAGIRMFENVAPPLRMFELCLEKGFSKAARFYWEKLNEVEKVSNLTYFARKCWQKNDASFLMEKHCENLLFLINQMGEEERYLFFTDYADEIIRLVLSIWPYQELIVDLLKYDWNIDELRWRRMAHFVISFSESMNRLEYLVNNELVFQIMQKVWGNMPLNGKLLFVSENHLQTSKLFLTLNPKIINLVLNDPIITKVDRKKMDSSVKENFVRLVKMGKFDFLNRIIETLVNFISEPKEYLKQNFSNYKFVLELIENDESFGLLDQFLDWSAASEAERARLKDKINTISVCRYLTEPPHRSLKFKLADKFLKWRLETDAEVKNFKDEMKSYNFVILPFSRYVRIKSGDLSWLRPGDSLVTQLNECPYDNADGLTILKFEDATELNQEVVFGIKSSCTGVDYDFLGPDFCPAQRRRIHYLGTKVGDFIVFTVREIWKNTGGSYFNLNEVVNLSNAFIKFYYDTDEEVLDFKKTKLHVLVTENLIEFLLDAVESHRHVPENFLDDFCEFCMIPSEKIEEIKIEQRNGIEKFLDTYLIDQLNFELVDIYLNWLFEENKKKEVSKKFVNSSNKGALLCVFYLKKYGEFSPVRHDWIPEICRWLSLLYDKDKFKKDVFALNEIIPEWFLALI